MAVVTSAVAVFITLSAAATCLESPMSCSAENNTMTPEDPFAFGGELLRLCCNVTGTYCDLSDHCNITFYKKDIPIDVQSWSTHATPLVCMSQTVAVETPKVMYYCAISWPGYEVQPLEQCMGYQIVRTDHSPHAAMENVSEDCLMEGAKFSCRFPNVMNHFLYPQHASVILFYGNQEKGMSQTCSMECSEHWCVYKLNQGQHFQNHNVLHFNLKLTYTVNSTDVIVNRSAAYSFSVTPSNRVKLPPPQPVSVTESAGRCLRVTWSPTSTERLEWRLTLHPRSRHSTAKVPVELFDGDNTTVTRTVCSLAPFTNYTVTLERRPVYSQVWSDAATAIGSTPMEVQWAAPGQPPELAPDYSVIGAAKEAVFYWKAVPEEAAHGPGLRYIVNVTTTNGPIPSREPLYYLETNFTQAAVRLDDLDLGGGGVLYVKAVNEAGPGQDEAALRFAPSVDGAVDVYAVVENETATSTTLNVTWFPASTHAENYTFFWCLRSRRDPRVCKGDIHWEIIPPTSKWHSREIAGGRPGQILYGLSEQSPLTRAKVATGFRLSACLFRRDDDGSLVPTMGCGDKLLASTSDRKSRDVLSIVLITSMTSLVACCCIWVLRAKYRQRRRLFAEDIVGDDKTPARETWLATQYCNGVAVTAAVRGGWRDSSVPQLMLRQISDQFHSSGYDSQSENGGARNILPLPTTTTTAPRQVLAGQCLITPEGPSTSLEDDQTTRSENDPEEEDSFSQNLHVYVAASSWMVSTDTQDAGASTPLLDDGANLSSTSRTVDDDPCDSFRASGSSDEESYALSSSVLNRYISQFPGSVSHKGSASCGVNDQEGERRPRSQSCSNATVDSYLLVTTEQIEELTFPSFTVCYDHANEGTRAKVASSEAAVQTSNMCPG